jgi:hypothetical protein
MLRRTSLRKRRPGKPRRGRTYDPAYMRWVKKWPCAACGLEGGSDPCHTKAIDRGGMGQKTSDRSCIPLCRVHHREFDQGRYRATFCERYRLDIDRLVERLNAIYSDYKS